MPKRRHLDNIITIGQLPREYVESHSNTAVVTPKGVRTTLAEAYKKYNQTHINPNDVPGLTDYLIKQDQPDISEQALMSKRAGDRFVNKLGKERDQALMTIATGIFGGGALASGLALAPVATLGSIGGGIAGEKVFNNLYGGNWGQDVERWTNGYIPGEYGAMLNPGSLIGGGVGGVGSDLLANIGRNISNRNLFAYEYLNPVGYQDALSRGWTVAKHILKDKRLPTDKLNASNAFWHNIKDGEYIDPVKYRDLAYRKALNLGEPVPLYLPNNDGSFRYNLNFLKNHAQFDLLDGTIALPAPGIKKVIKLGDNNMMYGIGEDRFTANGGRVSIDEDFSNSVRTMYDNWQAKLLSHYLERKGDHSPYKETIVKLLGGDNSKIVRKLRSLDMLPLLGGKSFTLKTTYPYTTGVYENMAGKLLGRRGASTKLADIVDFSRLDNQGLLIR